jgi:hypothetical protein
VIQEEGLYVNNMNAIEKHLSISIAPVQSRGESLVKKKTFWVCLHKGQNVTEILLIDYGDGAVKNIVRLFDSYH